MGNAGPSIVDKFRYASRHFVAMTWFQKDVRDPAKEVPWQYFAVSGIIMAFGDTWYLATAGHIVDQLEENRAETKSEVKSFALIDHGGVEARYSGCVPFRYEDAEKYYVVNLPAGLDFGFIRIDPFFRKPLEVNAVVPLTEKHWRQPSLRFREYAVIGCPTARQHMDDETDFDPMTGHAQITVMPVAKLSKKDEPKAAKHPRFFARVLDQKVTDIDGFSGGPVIGFGAEQNGVIPYRVVAMQYSWKEKQRVIRASPLSVFVPLFEEQLASTKK